VVPRGAVRVTRNDVEGLHGVVEVGDVDILVSPREALVLNLSDEHLMFPVSEELTFIRVEIHVVTEHLGGGRGGEPIAALDANLNVVILESEEGKSLRPVLTEEEGEHVVVTTVVFLPVVEAHTEGSLGGRIPHERVVNTLDEQRIHGGHHLTTDPKGKLREVCGSSFKETIVVVLGGGDVIGLNPDIAEKITLGTDGNDNLVTGTKRADVVHALGLHGEVGVSFVVLTEKAYFRLTGDVDVLGTYRHEFY